MKSFQDFFTSLSFDVNIKGKAFEHANKRSLKSDPVWSSQFKQTLLWEEFPHQTGRDTGIGLVTESISGEVWANQCNAYSPESHPKRVDIESFLIASNRKFYAYRLLVTTTKGMGNNVKETLSAQEKPVQVVDWIRLSDSVMDWHLALLDKIKP